MPERTSLVTGVTSGIGRALALGLARAGHEVLAVARDPTRGQEAVDSIRSESGNEHVILLLADLSRLIEVRRLAAEVERYWSRLHVLVHNAGVYHSRRHETPDGLEETFAVNHLAPFLLTNLLLARLRAAAPARVVTVASAAHRVGRIHFDDLQLRRRYGGRAAYCQSKLANLLFTFELAARVGDLDVAANCFHPGVVATRLARDRGPWALAFRIAKPFMLRPEDGARTGVWLATSPDAAGITGRYFESGHETRPAAAALDARAARRLWDESARLVGIPPEPAPPSGAAPARPQGL